MHGFIQSMGFPDIGLSGELRGRRELRLWTVPCFPGTNGGFHNLHFFSESLSPRLSGGIPFARALSALAIRA